VERKRIKEGEGRGSNNLANSSAVLGKGLNHLRPTKDTGPATNTTERKEIRNQRDNQQYTRKEKHDDGGSKKVQAERGSPSRLRNAISLKIGGWIRVKSGGHAKCTIAL